MYEADGNEYIFEKDWGISKYFLGYFSNGEGVDFVDTLS